MTFTPSQLLATLATLPAARRYVVAYSGGLDSHVLLHAMTTLRPQLPVGTGGVVALHVDHGLQEQSAAWATHCQTVCAGLDVPCEVLSVDARPLQGEGPEAAAREARYQALAQWLCPGDCLLTAHHQDDQAETLLLQLMRGAGPRGLAAMPLHSPLGRAMLARPLLELSRQALEGYARAHGLSWVDDPSNRHTHLDRNFLRHEILPRLQQRWPSLHRTLARGAGHQGEAAALLDSLGRQDLAGLGVTEAKSCVPVAGLGQLEPVRQRNLLRSWLYGLGLPMPSQTVLERVRTEMLTPREDAMPLVHWTGAEVRRYRGQLYAMPPLAEHDPARSLAWADTASPLPLESAGGVLSARAVQGEGLRAAALAEAGCRVAFRRGGEHCRPSGRGHRHSLKKLFQEQGIPPWQRDRLPLIFIGSELAAVANLWVCEPFQALPGEAGLCIDWQPGLLK